MPNHAMTAAPVPYFAVYDARQPPEFPALSRRRAFIWHLLAGLTVGLGAWYLSWRWLHSLNPDHLLFSVVVAMAETLAFVGTLIFIFDIWDEGDTPVRRPPDTRRAAGLTGDGRIRIDVFITTCDESEAVVAPTISDAQRLRAPPNCEFSVFLLDDGDRSDMRRLADRLGVGYFRRDSNLGFKAGNIRNALRNTDGDFVVICDADTRLLEGFLENVLGYFRDPAVAWVQTPHWFYDTPAGISVSKLLSRILGTPGRLFAGALGAAARRRVFSDPFGSDASVFFDVIQRRRNRHGASFCCGAGSIHRRDALFQGALRRFSQDVDAKAGRLCGQPAPHVRQAVARSVEIQPLRFHVSEDLYTSIILHTDTEAGWKSVYHPQVEARMLSPWSMDAWATQRLKYAGGTFDIMLHDNPLFAGGMPLATKLHYLATFWSYLGVLWMPVLLLAPAVSLVFGLSAVESYSALFFMHLLPVLLCNQAAMAVGCKGHDFSAGSALAVASLPIQLRALWMILRGQRPRFPPTPKLPGSSARLRMVLPNLVILAVLVAAAVIGLVRFSAGNPAHQAGLVTVNMFWLVWNAIAVGKIVPASIWNPEWELEQHTCRTEGASQDGHEVRFAPL